MRSSKDGEFPSCFCVVRFSAPPFFPLMPRSICLSSSLERTVSPPAVASWGYFAEIAAMSAGERPSDLRNASASPGAEAAATRPRALGFFLILASVESRDLPIDEAEKERTWLWLLSATARARTVGVRVAVGDVDELRAKAPPAPADFGTPAVEKRAIDARIVEGERFRAEEARRRENDAAAGGRRKQEGWKVARVRFR